MSEHNWAIRAASSDDVERVRSIARDAYSKYVVRLGRDVPLAAVDVALRVVGLPDGAEVDHGNDSVAQAGDAQERRPRPRQR